MRYSLLIFFLLSLLFFSCKDVHKKAKPNNVKIEIQNNTRAKNVSILEKEFAVVNLNSEAISRKIWLYLPPNYSSSKENYPVIYMHDAQNLFDKTTSYAGEWGVDEILNDVYKNTQKGFIVVGINNDGKERINEYSPWKHKKYGGGTGDNYLNMIIEELKPYIDANYRTKPNAEFTGIIGSSMGGLISYYAGLKYPNIFGKIGVISPSFWFSKEVLDYTEEKAKDANIKMYFLLGDKEGMTKDFNEVSALLLKSGFKKENLKKKIIEGGEHNEAFWNRQFLEVITYLYNL